MVSSCWPREPSPETSCPHPGSKMDFFPPCLCGASTLHTTSGLLHENLSRSLPFPFPTPAPQLLGPTKRVCVGASGAERADSPRLPCATQHKDRSVHPAWRAHRLPSSARHWDTATESPGSLAPRLQRPRWPRRRSHTQVGHLGWPDRAVCFQKGLLAECGQCLALPGFSPAGR